MQKNRHELFRQIALALSHQQNRQAVLALAYWENVLRLLPEPIQIQNEILKICRHLVEQESAEGSRRADEAQVKLRALTQRYEQTLNDEEALIAEQVFRAVQQQCGKNYTLAFVYWKSALKTLSSDELVVTLAVHDLCRSAHQLLQAGHLPQCLDLYLQILATFPEFIEGYINLSLLLYRHDLLNRVFPLFAQIPTAYRETFLVQRYTELYQRLKKISQQFDYVPYAAVEDIITALQSENTFYPALNQQYFRLFVSELINREKGFFERRRRTREQKAIAKTSRQIVKEGIALGQRVTLAKQATLEEIPLYLYDNNIRIAEVLVNNPNMTEEDAQTIAETTHVAEILALLRQHFRWGKLCSVRLTIALNPQTLTKDAVQIIGTLNITELAKVFHKKTLSPEVRIEARERIQSLFHDLDLPDKFAMLEVTSGEILKLLTVVHFELSSFLMNALGRFHNFPDILINICRWTFTPETILAIIGRNPQFTKNTRIRFALLINPKTPAEIIENLLRTTNPQNVRELLLNRHLPASVKQTIRRLYPALAR